MIIVPRTKNRILRTVPRRQWMEGSLSAEKDQFGNPGIKTYFRLRARLNDGHVCWAGWYEDRDDFDAVLFAIASSSLRYERSLWRLSSPEWHPGLSEIESYDFAVTTFITAPTGSNQTYNVPSDWNSANNSIECLGAGGSGGALRHANTGIRYYSGGGGGGYGKYSNLSLTASGTATYQIGAGGAAVSGTGANGNGSNGNAGGDTWFNGTTYSGASVGGVGGGAGAFSLTAGVNGGAGGGGKGTSNNTGGRGGNITGTQFRTASGGGGAAGLNGAGGNGGDVNNTQTASAGGTGDNGSGGAGGAGSAAATGNAGGNGTEWSASYGSGGGGGGLSAANLGTTVTNGVGGSYGGGSGGTGTVNNDAFGAAGANGLIVIIYEPVVIFGSRNMPMLGM
jgi:hypothetical protein